VAYTLQRFGNITLPLYNRRTDMTPVLPRTALLATAAGTFDAWGSDRAPQKLPHSITLSCVLSETAVATWRTSIDALRAAVGARALLYRVADDDGTVQRCTARLIDMDYQRATKNRLHQELTLGFQQLDAWRGKSWDSWTLDDGKSFDEGDYLDSAAVALDGSMPSISVGGNLPATNVVATIDYGGAVNGPDLLQFCARVSGGDCSVVTLEGPFPTGTTFVLDNAARSFTKDGSDAYSLLDTDTPFNHSGTPNYPPTSSEWLAIPPGTVLIGVIADTSDGGATGSIVFEEAWA
jgi:hypothetical protein